MERSPTSILGSPQSPHNPPQPPYSVSRTRYVSTYDRQTPTKIVWVGNSRQKGRGAYREKRLLIPQPHTSNLLIDNDVASLSC